MQSTAQRLDNIIKSARKIMRKDKGLNGDLDRLPMLTWIMFLKFLDDMEHIEEEKAQMSGKRFNAAIEYPYRWRDWAAEDGGITGPDLLRFLTSEETELPSGLKGPGLFAYLKSLRGESGQRDRKDVVSTVFRDLSNRMLSGYLLRDVINLVDGIHFDASEEIHTLGRFYETLLREMRDAAGDSGEFYTPRPIVRFMVQVTDPRIGEKVLDPACGTGGFLSEAFMHIAEQADTVEKRQVLQDASIYGGEAKSLPFLLVQMNLLLHGLEAPQISPDNSLNIRLAEIGEGDRFEVILSNPPFGGEEETGILNNFPEDRRTTETALLFLQMIMRRLKRNGKGRAAVVVPHGVLFGGGIAARIKADLIKEFNLHTVLRLPEGVFAPYTGIATNIIFFDTKHSAGDIWYYEQPRPEGRKNYTKTAPLTSDDLKACLDWWHAREENEQAWKVKGKDLIETDDRGRVTACDLDLKNPNAGGIADHRTPHEIVESIEAKEHRILAIMGDIKRTLMETM
nr:class I SAM-dependent DNA methyltransferase [Mesorhizobium sp.]